VKARAAERNPLAPGHNAAQENANAITTKRLVTQPSSQRDSQIEATTKKLHQFNIGKRLEGISLTQLRDQGRKR
jgi:hypothetical protein